MVPVQGVHGEGVPGHLEELGLGGEHQPQPVNVFQGPAQDFIFEQFSHGVRCRPQCNRPGAELAARSGIASYADGG